MGLSGSLKDAMLPLRNDSIQELVGLALVMLPVELTQVTSM